MRTIQANLADEEERRPWRWRNCRSLIVGIAFAPFPWDWHFGVNSVCDGSDAGGCYGKEWWLLLGPVAFNLHADHGNISTGDWRARFGLSETEAWERSK